MAAAPQSPTSSRSTNMNVNIAIHELGDGPIPPSTTASRDGAAAAAAAETVVEIGPDGERREWRVGAMETNPSGEMEREWGMGRV